MSRTFLSALLAGAVLFAAVLPATVQAKDDDEREDDRGRGRGSEAPGRNRSEGGEDVVPPTPASEAEGKRPAETVGRFRMEENSRTVHGRHVSFIVNDTGVRNFTAEGVALFDLTVLSGEDDEGGRLRFDGSGSNLVVRTDAFTLKAHDNPSATAKIETDGGVALFTFGAGANLTQESDGRVAFRVGAVSGLIRGPDVSVNGSVVRVDDEALLILHKSRGGFDVHREEIGRAIGRGHVGAEATLGKRAEDLVQEVVSYGNVTMTTLRAERGNVTVAIEGHGTEGRVVVLNVDGRIVGAQKREDLTVTVDNLTIPPASSLQDVLDPDDDGFLPEYYVVFDPGTESFQLLVSVPHYSVHILSLTAPIPLPPPSVVIGILAGVALLVPGGYVLFRRKD